MNGSESDSAETSTPRARSESMVVCIGRRLAPSSPSKEIRPSASVLSGGTKRITVPASPQSISAGPVSFPGVTKRSVPCHSNAIPRDSRAWIINLESRDTSGATNSVGSLAIADSRSSRLVSDFDPGSATVASRSRPLGAGQNGCKEVIRSKIPNLSQSRLSQLFR